MDVSLEKARYARYRKTDKRKAVLRRYNASLKGIATRKRANDKFRKTPKRKAYIAAYKKTSKWREIIAAYTHSEKFKIAQAKYRATENGIQTTLRARKKFWSSEKGRMARRLGEQRRRARKASVPNTLTKQEWSAILFTANGYCHYCKRASDKLTMDHVMPLSKGGAHSKENVVAACGPCNFRKQAKILTLSGHESPLPKG